LFSGLPRDGTKTSFVIHHIAYNPRAEEFTIQCNKLQQLITPYNLVNVVLKSMYLEHQKYYYPTLR
jgi:hypothetical protein